MERLLTIKEVAELLQVKVNTLYSWVFTNKIPFVKINGVLRFKEKAIGKWIENHAKVTKDFRSNA